MKTKNDILSGFLWLDGRPNDPLTHFNNQLQRQQEFLELQQSRGDLTGLTRLLILDTKRVIKELEQTS